MIAVLFLALSLAPQSAPRVEDLSYMDTYICVRLGQIGQEILTDDGAKAPSDRALFDDFVTLEQRATAALEPAKVREGDRLSPLHIEHGAAEETLEAMSEDQKLEAMNLCGNVFQAGVD